MANARVTTPRGQRVLYVLEKNSGDEQDIQDGVFYVFSESSSLSGYTNVTDTTFAGYGTDFTKSVEVLTDIFAHISYNPKTDVFALKLGKRGV